MHIFKNQKYAISVKNSGLVWFDPFYVGVSTMTAI